MAVFIAFVSFGINYFFGLRRYKKNAKDNERNFKMMNDSPDTMI